MDGVTSDCTPSYRSRFDLLQLVRSRTRIHLIKQMSPIPPHRSTSKASLNHVPVLANQLVDALVGNTKGTYVDCTYGRGGHAKLLLNRLDLQARVVGIDRDTDAETHGVDLSKCDSRFQFVLGRFGELEKLVGISEKGKLDGVYFDLGLSTPQIQTSERGFSFDRDGPLDMRMDRSSNLTAEQWLFEADKRELSRVLRQYGDVPNANQVANSIVAQRPIRTTHQLANVVKQTLRPGSSSAKQLARVFQSIRIHINDELSEIESGLASAFDLLRVGGRLGVITFHSLERRITRQKIAAWSKTGGDPSMPLREIDKPRCRIVIKGLKPTEMEISTNAASRSAMLQVVEKLR